MTHGYGGLYPFLPCSLLYLPSQLTLVLVKSKDSELLFGGDGLSCASPTNFACCCRFSFHFLPKFSGYYQNTLGWFLLMASQRKCGEWWSTYLWPPPGPPTTPQLLFVLSVYLWFTLDPNSVVLAVTHETGMVLLVVTQRYDTWWVGNSCLQYHAQLLLF